MIKATLMNLWGTDKTIAQSAWVSSGRGGIEDDSRVERLIKMLADEGHETPFEHVTTQWHIKAPQRIQVQLLRHRIASHNVASARYGHKFEEMFDITHFLTTQGLPIELVYELSYLKCKAADLISDYNKLLNCIEDKKTKRRVRELAAFALPQGVMTEQVLSINLRSLKNLLRLRLSEHAQKEVRIVAQEMKKELDKREEIKHTVNYYFGDLINDRYNV